ncbi:MAG: PD-(D/E)XK nuclease family protein, partial [Prevotellaceae bacterium]|nr:PD-(D/E)XK nuclease family protein [Prevotellaceae bacterium]
DLNDASCHCGLEPQSYEKQVQIKIGGIIDSIRLKDNDLSIVDYKTSANEQTAKDLETLFDGNNKSRAKYILQALIYALVLEKDFCSYNILPILLYLPKMGNLDDFSEKIKISVNEISDFRKISDEFSQLLKTKLVEIFDETTPFKANFDENRCQYCEFLNICS